MEDALAVQAVVLEALGAVEVSNSIGLVEDKRKPAISSWTPRHVSELLEAVL
jgi:hypothetical protein